MAATSMQMANTRVVLQKVKTLLPSLLQRHLRCMSTSPQGTFKYEDLEIEFTKSPRPKPDDSTLQFGKEFADHMLEVDWTEQGGWGKPQIHPLRHFSMHPAARVYHYAVEVFEGTKGYRGYDGRIRLFRPDQNVNRMLTSVKRSALPEFDGDELAKCIKKLVSIDKDWVPKTDKCSLYIRPTMIGVDPSLGVSPSQMAKLFVITGPVGPYFPTGFKPVSLLADPQYVRAWEGGCGSYKMGSNYAPTIAVQVEALKKHNCQQVVWLYGPEHRVTEVGTMNFFVYWVNEQGEQELVTPPLESGLILPGVTRKSIIELAEQWGEFRMTQRDVNMGEIKKALQEGRIREMFGAGTACIVCPIERIHYLGEWLDIPTMKDDAPMTHKFLNELQDIHYGRKPSDWVVEID